MKNLFLAFWLISSVCFGQVVIEGNGQKITLPEGKYTITVGKTVEPEVPKPEPLKPELPNCGCGDADFTIVSIKKAEGFLYNVTFDACNVNPLTWEIGGKSSTFMPTSATFQVDLSGISAGDYPFKITSKGCNGKAIFSLTIKEDVAPNPDRGPPTVQFIENGTGNSVDFNADNGISNNFPEQFKRFAENGVDVIRLVFSVGSYHPSDGVFKNAKLSDAIQWVRSLPNAPKVDLLLVPTFPMADGRFAHSDLHCDADGHLADCTFGLATFPSYYSETAATILDEAYDNLFPYLVKNHLSDINDLSFAGGTSEEHYMPYTSNFAGGGGCGAGYGGIGDYSEAALKAWHAWLTNRFGSVFATLPYRINGRVYQASNAPLPYIQPTNGNNYNLDFNQAAHREVTRFWNDGVFNIWKRFYDKVKQYTPFNAEYFVADQFNDQGIRWTFNAGTMARAMQLCDVWYHSYNHSPYDWGHNLVGTDILLGGSFGEGKISAIEYDSFDAGTDGNGGSLNVDHLKKSIRKFVEHGGKKIHWAMNWNKAQIDQIGEVMKWVRENANSWTYAYRPNAPTVTLSTGDLFNNSGYIDNVWQSQGNSLSNPYAASVMNIRVVDSFVTSPQP